MPYDTTGPTTRNETASLLWLLGLLTVIAVATWLTLELHTLSFPKPTATSARTPTTQQADANAIDRVNDNLTIVKVGDTVVNIYQNETNVWPSRSYSRDNPDAAERWQLAGILNAIAHDPQSAERYDAQNVAEKLRTLNLRPPQLTVTQRNTLRDLFLAAQDAKGADRRKADQALQDAVANMPVPLDEQKSFDDAIANARALLTPAQLELIRTGGHREPKPTTKPVSRPMTETTK